MRTLPRDLLRECFQACGSSGAEQSIVEDVPPSTCESTVTVMSVSGVFSIDTTVAVLSLHWPPPIVTLTLSAAE